MSLFGELLSLTGSVGNVPLYLPVSGGGEGVVATLGRSKELCSTVLQSSLHISKQHCRLTLQRDKNTTASAAMSAAATTSSNDGGRLILVLTDLSSNGTFVNGKLLGMGKSVRVENGDEISLTPAPKQLEETAHESVEQIAFVFRDCEESGRQRQMVVAETSEAGVLQELDFVSKLGSGAFGVVYLGLDKKTNLPLAVKTIDKVAFLKAAGGSLTREAMKEAVEKGIYEEVRVMTKLKHPHIVGLHHVFDTPGHVVISMDLCKGGDLEALISKRKSFSETDARALHYQIVQGLCYLHEMAVVHRDLKPGNILIKEKVDGTRVPVLKISDFGLSKILDRRNGRCHTLAGTPLFIAPEVMSRAVHSPRNQQTDGYGTAADMWSAGVILFLMITGKFPFDIPALPALLPGQILKCAQQDKNTAFDILPVSSDCKDHLARLLTIEPARLSASEALEHPYLEARVGSRKITADGLMERGMTVHFSKRARSEKSTLLEGGVGSDKPMSQIDEV